MMEKITYNPYTTRLIFGLKKNNNYSIYVCFIEVEPSTSRSEMCGFAREARAQASILKIPIEFGADQQIFC